MHPRHIRVFLSGSGDVADELAIAREVIDQLLYSPDFIDKISVRIITWNNPGAGTPMLATMTPQDAIDLGMPKPSDCDIAIVILWAWMGTPLPFPEYQKNNGEEYCSSIEWEYENAIQGADDDGNPITVVYRRDGQLRFDPDSQDFIERYEQYKKVKNFFTQFTHPLRGYNTYIKPEDFRQNFEIHIKTIFQNILDKPSSNTTRKSDHLNVQRVKFWEGSPFPGLKSFSEKEAPIFFGRGRETDELIGLLSNQNNRFVGIVGASGSGKSSIVKAGLIPRLRNNAIPGSKDWLIIDFSPDMLGVGNPFVSLYYALQNQNTKTNKFTATNIETQTQFLKTTFIEFLETKADWVQILLFIDQFEELFTMIDPHHRLNFIDALYEITQLDRVKTIITLRADFYKRCLEIPLLAILLQIGTFPLPTPDRNSLHEMISKPAIRAGLSFEDDLNEKILDDTGSEPGSLALMAFCLDELYRRCKNGGVLTQRAYDDLGGVKGAIGKRAQFIFNDLDSKAQLALPDVFQELVDVDTQGMVTKKRASLDKIKSNPIAANLINAMVKERLLVADTGKGKKPFVEVSHETLLVTWPQLTDWINETKDYIHTLHRLRQAVREWKNQNHNPAYLWPDERLRPVYIMMEHLNPELEEEEKEFIRPEIDRLIIKLDDINTNHILRSAIGERMSVVGDTRFGVGVQSDGLPEIAWCQVPSGKVELNDEEGKLLGEYAIGQFQIAKYPITYIQFQTFIEADDGYWDDRWWKDLSIRHPDPGEQRFKFMNYPRETVSWFDAVAFCRWLSYKMNFEIRLPTEWEWQLAAGGGNTNNEFAWGLEPINNYANTYESGLSRTTAVGMYPFGASHIGALDMSGNVEEWCLNEYSNPTNINVAGDVSRVLRGGSCFDSLADARVTYRYGHLPNSRLGSWGFRVCCSKN